MSFPFDIRNATTQDLQSVQQVLETVQLESNDTHEHLAHFFVAEQNGSIIGTIGLEIYGSAGLLRSAAVLPQFQGSGIGNILIQALEQYAIQQTIDTLFLLTTTAHRYFKKKGFTRIDRTEVRGVVLASKQFNGACPASAVIMKKELGKTHSE